MPLPKMPTRPATILPELAKKSATRTRRKVQAQVEDAISEANDMPAPDLALVEESGAAAQAASAAAPRAEASTPLKPTRTARKTARGKAAVAPASDDTLPLAPTRDDANTRPASAETSSDAASVAFDDVAPVQAEAGVDANPAAFAPDTAPGSEHPLPRMTAAERISVETAKLFVLDTNVLMHDPTSLFRFEEHDIYLPMMVLEELDQHKKGMSEVARNARQVSRTLDALIPNETSIADGVALDALGNREARGRLFLQTRPMPSAIPAELPVGKADNQILGVVHALQKEFPDREVVLVSKDINMRLKARTLGLAAEDYYNDQVLEDSDLLYTGVLQLPGDFWEHHDKDVESWQESGNTYYRVTGPLCRHFVVNQFVYLDGDLPLNAQVKAVQGDTAVLQTLRDYTHRKNSVWGITARNREQNFAFNLLMNPDCDFVSLLGQAGTGKTLLTLAAGLVQVLETKRYSEIIMTRVTVPVGEDIGFLPGTEEEKMQPWMGALEDNLDVLNMGEGERSTHGGGEWGRAATMDLIRSRIKVKSLNFMRGRTFLNKYLIIDEAQNLTPKQMKTLITRAGPGTKVVCLGNLAQIDTPYLTEASSGLSYVVDRFRGWEHAGHVTLQRGERSRLADYAAEVL